MSELTDRFKEMLIAHWRFDVAPTPGCDLPPFEDRFEAGMESAAEHHMCPEKRVKGGCRCVLND